MGELRTAQSGWNPASYYHCCQARTGRLRSLYISPYGCSEAPMAWWCVKSYQERCLAPQLLLKW